MEYFVCLLDIEAVERFDITKCHAMALMGAVAIRDLRKNDTDSLEFSPSQGEREERDRMSSTLTLKTSRQTKKDNSGMIGVNYCTWRS